MNKEDMAALSQLVESGNVKQGEIDDLIARGRARFKESILEKMGQKIDSGDVSLSDVAKLTG